MVASVVPDGCADRAGMPVGVTNVGVDGLTVDCRDGVIQSPTENVERPWTRFWIVALTP